MIAKSFQKYGTSGEPYEKNGRLYIRLTTGREVRWYSEAEYYKLYPEEPKKPSTPLKEVLGYHKNYVYVCTGDTFDHTEWFKQSDFRYCTLYGWYLCSCFDEPSDLPEGVSLSKLQWEDVAVDDYTLKPEAAIKKAVEAVKYEPHPSQFIGSIGDKLSITVKITKTIFSDSYYGKSTLHIMEDENQNVYTWTTTSRTLELNKIYTLSGTIKAHETFRNCKQTVLTRCRVKE